MTQIEIPDEIKITSIQRIMSKQAVVVDHVPGLIDLGVEAVITPKEAVILSYFLNEKWLDVEAELIIRKKK